MAHICCRYDMDTREIDTRAIWCRYGYRNSVDGFVPRPTASAPEAPARRVVVDVPTVAGHFEPTTKHPRLRRHSNHQTRPHKYQNTQRPGKCRRTTRRAGGPAEADQAPAASTRITTAEVCQSPGQNACAQAPQEAPSGRRRGSL